MKTDGEVMIRGRLLMALYFVPTYLAFDYIPFLAMRRGLLPFRTIFFGIFGVWWIFASALACHEMSGARPGGRND
jgi:hypothetical protein